jgi:3',5'-cyclic-AMP phosphodiesterase
MGINLIQITDCHLLRDKKEMLHGINPYSRLASTLAFIKKTHYDAYLFTGDIANDGDSESYQIFFELIDDIDCDCIIFPGNHDQPNRLCAAADASRRTQIISPDKPYILDDWAFIYVDTRVASKNHGFINEASLSQLSKNLKITNDMNTCLLLHHHPIPTGLDFIDKYRLFNSSEFQATLTDKVKLVIYGHVHNDYNTEINGIYYASGPSSGFQFNAKKKFDTRIYGAKAYHLEGDHISATPIFFHT